MQTQTQSNEDTQTDTQTPQQTRCFAHCHMTDAEYGFYSVCRSLTIPNGGKLYFDGRTLAKRFGSMSKDTPYRRAFSLLEKGWFVLLKDTAKRWNGTQSPRHYRVLTHEEWAEMHPGQCETPVPDLRIDEVSPVPDLREPVPDLRKPYAKEGHNLSNLSKDSYKKLLIEKPVPNLRMEVGTFVDRFSKSRRQSKAPEGQHLTGAPVPDLRIDVPNTYSPNLPMDIPSQVRRLKSVILNTLGTSFPVVQEHWERALTNLLDKKHSSQVIRNVFDFANTHHRKELVLITEHGPKAFENNFDRLHAAMHQEAQAEREGVTQ